MQYRFYASKMSLNYLPPDSLACAHTREDFFRLAIVLSFANGLASQSLLAISPPHP